MTKGVYESGVQRRRDRDRPCTKWPDEVSDAKGSMDSKLLKNLFGKTRSFTVKKIV